MPDQSEPVRRKPLKAILVNLMLVHAWTADELHELVDEAVAWIEAHPDATDYVSDDA